MYPSSGNFNNVPFVRPLEGPMHPGRVIAVYGTIPQYANRFAVNLQCGGAPSGMCDIALHVSVRFDQHCVVRNSHQGGGWQHEERDGGLPLSLRPGSPFQMLLLCEGHCFKIAFNGQHFHDFHHRMPYQAVSHVSVEGDVDINSVSGVASAGGSGHQTHNPGVPHIQNIGSIYPGRCLRVRGFVPHNAYRFSVNFATGPSMEYDDICLHVSTRPSEGMVEINTCRRGNWENGQQLRTCPVRQGQPFEMIILVDDFAYRVAFNGVHFAEWPHRLPYQSVNHVIVEGSVQLQLVSLEGQPRGGGYAPPPPPPHVPYYPSPYDSQGQGQGGGHHFPNPYHIL